MQHLQLKAAHAKESSKARPNHLGLSRREGQCADSLVEWGSSLGAALSETCVCDLGVEQGAAFGLTASHWLTVKVC